jgi:hypothetical protein
MSGERAARAIVRASQRGDVLLVLGLPAKLARLRWTSGLEGPLVAHPAALAQAVARNSLQICV